MPVGLDQGPAGTLKSLVARVFRVVENEPLVGAWEHAATFDDLVLPGFLLDWEEESPEEWLMGFPSRRRKILTPIMQEVMTVGCPVGHRFKSFVKGEMVLDSGKLGDPPAELVPLEVQAPRTIQAPMEWTHCVAGPKLRPMIHSLKRVWGIGGPVFYGSTKPEYLHQWLQRIAADGKRKVCMDLSMFDCTHSKESWAYCHHWYRRVVNCPDFWRVMKHWQVPNGRCGNWRYKAHKPVNASGRDDTALANAILNGVSMILAYAAAVARKRVTQLTRQDVLAAMKALTLSVVGDDSVASVPNHFPTGTWEEGLERWKAAIAEFGFKVGSCFWTDNTEEIVYLGMRPYRANGVWYWGPTLGRRLFKHHCMRDTTSDPYAWLHGIAKFERASYAHVPILSDMAEKVCELLQGTKSTAVQEDPHKPWKQTLKDTPHWDADTVATVCAAYGNRFGVNDVYDCVRAIRAVKRLPVVLDHFVLREMVLHDDN